MIIFFSILSLLIGAIPFGYIIVKVVSGKDIRNEGSGNIGSTNVKRVVGKKLSILVQFLDIFKGIVSVLLPMLFLKNYSYLDLSIIAICSPLGHMFSPFLSFKGGKGINTTLGAFFLICPIPILISTLLHLLLGLKVKIVSIRSIILAFSIPLFCYIFKYEFNLILILFINALIITIKHKSNIKRLILKTEK